MTLGGCRHGHGSDDEKVRVTITPPPQAGGARVFGGGASPYAGRRRDGAARRASGYNGDYQGIQVFTLTGFPLLAKLTPTVALCRNPPVRSFTMAGDDCSQISASPQSSVANLKMEVFDVATGQVSELRGRRGFHRPQQRRQHVLRVPWDERRCGGRAGGNAPCRTARAPIDLSVLKALGDPRNLAHFERWSSPPITIARPAPTTTPSQTAAGAGLEKTPGPSDLRTFDLFRTFQTFRTRCRPLPPSRLPPSSLMMSGLLAR